MKPVNEQGFLVIADISGFTSYLASSELNHAHEIITDLLETISRELASLLTVAKFEGDAVFAFVSTQSMGRPEFLLELIERTYVMFRNRILSSNRHSQCTCQACGNMMSLDLKFFVHFGEFVRRMIGGTMDVIGNDVTIVHRMTKNTVTESTGLRGYTLISKEAAERIGIDADQSMKRTEHYEHLGSLECITVDLEGRLSELTELRRLALTDDEVHVQFHANIHAPRSKVWEWLNDPVKRAQTELITVRPGQRSAGRTTEGSLNYCEHDGETVIEEVTEWNPFEFASLKSTSSIGVIRQSYELSERGEETIFSYRMNLEPNLRLLRPFGKIIMKILAKAHNMEGIIDRIKRYSEEDWSLRRPEN